MKEGPAKMEGKKKLETISVSLPRIGRGEFRRKRYAPVTQERD